MFCSTTELATKYRFHKSTINRWIKEGKLKAYTTPGGRYRILESDFRIMLGLEDLS